MTSEEIAALIAQRDALQSVVNALAACKAHDPNCKKKWATAQHGKWFTVSLTGDLLKSIQALATPKPTTEGDS